MKKILCVLLLFATLITTVFAVCGSAFSGFGIAVLSEDVELTKSGLRGQRINFSDEDFKRTFCITDFKDIEITKLPSYQEGTLLKAGRRVKLNSKIKRRNIASLVFIPASVDVKEASFNFKIDGVSADREYTCKIRFLKEANSSPVIREEGEVATTLKTQSEIGTFGKLSAKDPEGDKLQYIIISYPKNGILRFTNKNEGRYKYTPEKNFTGYDKFIYVVKDEYGNYSSAETVTIRIVERMSEQVFIDMENRQEYNAAVAMSALGIMSGKTLGDDMYFMPNEEITKAEFLAMAMKANGIKKSPTLSKSFFDDNDEIPLSLVGYVATAQKMGIVDGKLSSGKLIFSPNDKITKYESALIMSKILGTNKDDEDHIFSEFEGIPVWAKGAVTAMQTLGIFDSENTKDLKGYVTRASAADYLYRMISI